VKEGKGQLLQTGNSLFNTTLTCLMSPIKLCCLHFDPEWDRLVNINGLGMAGWLSRLFQDELCHRKLCNASGKTCSQSIRPCTHVGWGLSPWALFTHCLPVVYFGWHVKYRSHSGSKRKQHSLMGHMVV
jgi:hypothetical protein